MAIDWGETLYRRLPVYLLVDTSRATSGRIGAEINDVVAALIKEMMSDSEAQRCAHMRVIAFGQQVYQWDFTPITQFTYPSTLPGGDARSFGAALTILNQSLDHDLMPNSPIRRGDYRPFVFILIAGNPTDEWRGEAQRLAARRGSARPQQVCAITFGEHIDIDALRQIARMVLPARDMTSEVLRSLFVFFDDEDIKVVTPAMASINDIATLPPLPPGMFIYDESPAPPRPSFAADRVAPAQVARQSAVQRPRIFVSHSSRDNAFARRLVADLETAGASVWVDMDQIRQGDFMQRINEGLANSDWLVLVLTPNAIQSQYVPIEVFAAMSLVQHGRMQGVIPIVAETCDPSTMPPLWMNLHRYDATNDYQRALQGLLVALGMRAS